MQYTHEQTQSLQFALKYIHSFIHDQYKKRIKPDPKCSYGYIFMWNMKTGEVANIIGAHSMDTMTDHHTFVSVSISNWGCRT